MVYVFFIFMRFILPAAGIGSRWGDLTLLGDTKGLFKIGNKEIIGRSFEEMLFLKPDLVSVVLGHDGENVERYLRDNYGSSKYDFEFDFVYQDDKDGDGGATRIALNSPKMRSYSGQIGIKFIVDTLSTLSKSNQTNLVNILNSFDMPDALVMTDEVDNSGSYGLMVKEDDRLVSMLEASGNPVPGEVAIGEYYFKNASVLRDTLNFLYRRNLTHNGGKEYKLAQYLDIMIRKGVVKTFLVDNWGDTGSHELLLQTHRDIMKVEGNDAQFQYGDDVKIIPPCHFGKGVSIRNSVIGPNVSIPDGSHVSDSYLVDTVGVGNGASIQGVNLDGAVLGKGSKIFGDGNNTLRDKSHKVKVGPDCNLFLQTRNLIN